MSEPTYRIELRHEYSAIHDEMRWYAYAYRVTDDTLPVAVGSGEGSLEAVSRCRAELRGCDFTRLQPLYLDEDDNVTAAPSVPEPQSVRA